MARKIRIALAALCFAAIKAMFLDPSGTLPRLFAPLARLQLLPAVLAGNLLVLLLLAVITLLLGRIYCSVLCPMGVFQDLVSWLSARRKGKKARFHFIAERKWLRYGIWVLYIAALVAGCQVVVALIAPYSTYGRFIQGLTGGHAWTVLAAAAAVMLAVTLLAWWNGREWCNSVCPVGTTLSFLSRFSLLRPVIDADACRNCKVCEHKCKASCIDISTHRIDYSRCVDCFDCIDNCRFDALHYRVAWGRGTAAGAASRPAETAERAEETAGPVRTGGQPNARRAFLASTAMIGTALALKAREKKVVRTVGDTRQRLAQAIPAPEGGADDKKRDGGLADILPKIAPDREVPLTPPGSAGVKEFYRRCTACQLCVAACPNHVLRPSTDPSRFMQPEMSYENGWCRPECTDCSRVCPTGAIGALVPAEKTAWPIGLAQVDYELCVVNRDGVSCGNCARHCPSGAIRMVPSRAGDPDSPLIPSVDENLCIGCGACENLCPSRPLSAITVNGRRDHLVR